VVPGAADDRADAKRNGTPDDARTLARSEPLEEMRFDLLGDATNGGLGQALGDELAPECGP
jgi:hypothetical protein